MIDDHQLDRHFTRYDIKQLYDFQIEQLPNAPSISTCPTESHTDLNFPESEDRLLFDLLIQHSRWIHSYHSHDSLLENKIEENLSPEERRQGRFFSFSTYYSHPSTALDEYETLKRQPIQRLSSQQSTSPIANNTGD